MSRKVCPYCSHGAVCAPGRKMCQACLDYKALRAAIRSARFRKKGMCPRCGKWPPPKGFILCLACREKHRKTMKAYYRRHRESRLSYWHAYSARRKALKEERLRERVNSYAVSS